MQLQLPSSYPTGYQSPHPPCPCPCFHPNPSRLRRSVRHAKDRVEKAPNDAFNPCFKPDVTATKALQASTNKDTIDEEMNKLYKTIHKIFLPYLIIKLLSSQQNKLLVLLDMIYQLTYRNATNHQYEHH